MKLIFIKNTSTILSREGILYTQFKMEWTKCFKHFHPSRKMPRITTGVVVCFVHSTLESQVTNEQSALIHSYLFTFSQNLFALCLLYKILICRGDLGHSVSSFDLPSQTILQIA